MTKTPMSFALLLLAASVGPAHAAAKAVKPGRAADDDASRVAARIDEIIAASWAANGVKPAAPADDAAFLRRVTLDTTGKIPVVNDVRKFLSSADPYKRAAAVDRLLDSPGYVNHFTNQWTMLLVPEGTADFQRRYLLPGMYGWLRNHFAKNTPYDKMAHELVSLPMGTADPTSTRGGLDYGDNSGAATAMPFYFAKQAKPEEIAAAVGRIFLGVRLECAQCHDHPFGKWKREEFWSQASFFAGLKGRNQGEFFTGPVTEAVDRREINIPNTERVAQARFLDGKNPKWKFKVGARTTLADWMTAKDNPFFAKAITNRMWATFFGVGLVDPVDDLVDDNPASHPEVLDLLAKEFAEHDFDLKFLIRVITRTRSYQLASSTEGKPAELRLFARMPVRGLSAEQLFESLGVASGTKDPTTFVNRVYNFGSARQTFTEKFGEQEKRTEYQTSITQALTMMNNQLVTDATNPDKGPTLGAIASSTFMKPAAKVEALFLAALSRKPTAEESAKLTAYVEKGGAAKDERKALSDVYWALLNSTEFKFNH